jgi:tetratricopeptide (TPR) repeat protein
MSAADLWPSVAYNKVGDVLKAQGKLDEALKAYRDSLAIAERLAAADRSFRAIAQSCGAVVTTLRVVCAAETAAKRIRARLALGERGPDEKAIRQIAHGLNRASDIDLVLTNDSSMEDFHRQIDALLGPLIVAGSVKAASDRKGRVMV